MNKLYCIECPTGCLLTIIGSGDMMVIEGNKCHNGISFAKQELSNPTRTLTTTVRTKFPDVPVISVRTDVEIPKHDMMRAMAEINAVIVDQELAVGDTVLEDVAGTGARVIITSPALMQLGAELENKNADLERLGASRGGVARDSRSASSAGGVDAVRISVNDTVLDDIGMDAASGFVGAAGEAVGVQAAESDDAANTGDAKSKERLKQSRPHIKR